MVQPNKKIITNNNYHYKCGKCTEHALYRFTIHLTSSLWVGLTRDMGEPLGVRNKTASGVWSLCTVCRCAWSSASDSNFTLQLEQRVLETEGDTDEDDEEEQAVFPFIRPGLRLSTWVHPAAGPIKVWAPWCSCFPPFTPTLLLPAALTHSVQRPYVKPLMSSFTKSCLEWNSLRHAAHLTTFWLWLCWKTEHAVGWFVDATPVFCMWKVPWILSSRVEVTVCIQTTQRKPVKELRKSGCIWQCSKKSSSLCRGNLQIRQLPVSRLLLWVTLCSVRVSSEGKRSPQMGHM